jgi:hypothetical protein
LAFALPARKSPPLCCMQLCLLCTCPHLSGAFARSVEAGQPHCSSNHQCWSAGCTSGVIPSCTTPSATPVCMLFSSSITNQRIASIHMQHYASHPT